MRASGSQPGLFELYTVERGTYDPVRVQIRASGIQAWLADGHAQGGLPQDRRGSCQGGLATVSAFRARDVRHGLGKFHRINFRAPRRMSTCLAAHWTGPVGYRVYGRLRED